jgi:hypothetical protein
MTTDEKEMKTKLVSILTTTEVVIGEDCFLVDEYKDLRDSTGSLNSTTVMEKKPGMWEEIVDDELKDWIISAVEAHEREGVPF